MCSGLECFAAAICNIFGSYLIIARRLGHPTVSLGSAAASLPVTCIHSAGALTSEPFSVMPAEKLVLPKVLSDSLAAAVACSKFYASRLLPFVRMSWLPLRHVTVLTWFRLCLARRKLNFIMSRSCLFSPRLQLLSGRLRQLCLLSPVLL